MANKYTLYILLSVLAAILSGCGINIAIIDNQVIADRGFIAPRNIKPMDPNGPIYIRHILNEDGTGTYEYTSNRVPTFDMPDIATADFHIDEYKRNNYMVVKGKMTDGKTYPVILDTGANLDALIVQDIHIHRNNLAVYPLKNASSSESQMSLCAIEKLSIGDFNLFDYTGVSWGQHIELQLLGFITLARNQDICFPLPLMSKFKYFEFDTPARQVRFSAKKSFQPRQIEQWHQFPMDIEYLDNDPSKQFLFIDMYINGKHIRPMLDTGAGLGLIMNNRLWTQVKDSFTETRRRKFNFILPYHFEGSKPDCTAVTVKDLTLGDMNVRNAEITVLPETKKWKMTECIMGMACFKDKTTVLDFENSTLWVKK